MKTTEKKLEKIVHDAVHLGDDGNIYIEMEKIKKAIKEAIKEAKQEERERVFEEMAKAFEDVGREWFLKQVEKLSQQKGEE